MRASHTIERRVNEKANSKPGFGSGVGASKYLLKVQFHDYMMRSEYARTGGPVTWAEWISEAARQQLACLGKTKVEIAELATILCDLQSIANANEFNRRQALHLAIPFLFYEHVALRDLFRPQHYLSSERYESYRMFVAHSPFGPVQAEIRRKYASCGLVMPSTDCPILECDIGVPGATTGFLIALYFKYLAEVGRTAPGVSCALFLEYAALRTKLLGAILGERPFGDPAGDAPEPHKGDHPSPNEQSAPLIALLYCQCRLLCDAISSGAMRTLRIANIIQDKAAYSIIHHKNVFVGTINLAEAFAKEDVDMLDFLRKLKSSSWFNRGAPAESRFFRKLTSPGAPMFGVFTSEELDELSRWVGSDDDPASIRTIREADEVALELLREPLRVDFVAKRASGKRWNQRSLFFALLDDDTDSHAIDQAKAHAQATFKTAEQDSDPALRDGLYDYFAYSPRAFFERVDLIYLTQNREAGVKYAATKPLGRDALRKVLLASSPVALIDGAWLSGVPYQFHFERSVTEHLFQIYYEEMGNGDYPANHARIYAELLRTVAPGYDTLAAIRSTSLTEVPIASYAMANLHLALGQHAREFFPELLGWTMAVELVGLGGGFQFMSEQLERVGLDASFYKVHISADNLSTGHSHLARSVVMRFIDRTAAVDRLASEASWRRVWTGFRAYRMLDQRGPWA